MKSLKSENIFLRALEPEDLDFIYNIENDLSVWEVSNTQTPYSRFLIKQYLENAHQDIYEAKQLRLVICKNDNSDTIGLIDLFDFDPKNNRVGVGLVIQKEEFKGVGWGTEALSLIIEYAFGFLNVHQLYANIHTENEPSLRLFTKFGFQKIGIKKHWNFSGGSYKDEAMFQLIKNV